MSLCFRQTPFVCSPRYVYPNMYAESGMFTIFLDSNNVCSCARVDQPTSFRHSQRSVQGLKKTIGDAVTKHVTVGQASSEPVKSHECYAYRAPTASGRAGVRHGVQHLQPHSQGKEDYNKDSLPIALRVTAPTRPFYMICI